MDVLYFDRPSEGVSAEGLTSISGVSAKDPFTWLRV